MSKFTGNIIRLPAVTPTQNSASGVYTLDDQFTAQSSGTWPIVRDQYFNYTTLLLTGAVQGTAYPNPVTQPYSFLSDASTNNFVVSPNGDVSARPFNPYLNNYSAFFDGTGDYITVSGGMPSGQGTAFTLECWVYLNDLNDYRTITRGSSGGTLDFGIQSSGQVSLANTGVIAIATTPTGLVRAGVWTHIALTRTTGNLYTIYVNGTSYATGSNSTSMTANTTIGLHQSTASQYFSGYMTNFRVCNALVYSGQFTPSSLPLSATSQGATSCQLLCFQSNRFIDNSGNSRTITPSGNVAVSQNSPFVSYDTTNGSGYFDGNDWLSAPDSSAYTMGSGDFTVEAWVYCTAADFASSRYIIAQRNSSADTSISFAMNLIGGGARKVRLLCFDTGGASYEALCASDVINLNEWTHIAGVRNGTTLRIYVNGVQQGTANISTASLVDSDGGVAIGRLGDANFYYWLGYISNVRVTKGGCLYPSGTQFTPPAAPLTTTVSAGTVSLLTLQTRAPATNNGFIDSSPNNFVVTRNGNATQGSFSPFSPTGWGVYGSGTTSYAQLNNTDYALGTGDFTIEFWMYLTSDKATTCFCSPPSNPNLTVAMTGGSAGARLFYMEYGGAGTTLGAGSNYLNKWTHVAFVRSSGVVTCYQDGSPTNPGGTSKSASIGSTASLYLLRNSGDTSQDVPGYVSNFRICKSAVYTANFNPPTSALTTTSQGATNCVLLTFQSNRFRDNSNNNSTVTPSANLSVQAFSPFAPAQSYIPSQIGGSGYFDGSDYLSAPDNDAWHFGTGDFTIEAWYYPTTTNSQQIIVAQSTAAGGGTGLSWQLMTSNDSNVYLRALVSSDGSGWVFDLISTSKLQINAWNHVAFVRSGTAFQLYLNGAAATNGSATSSAALYNTTTPLTVGASNAPNQYVTGYMAGVRIVKGTAVYSGTTYTVPTAPPTAIPNTSLLLNFTNGGIVDATGKNNLETVGNSSVQTKVLKYGNGSIAFDKTTDTVVAPASVLLAVGSGDYTYDFWVYANSFSNTPVLFDTRVPIASLAGLQILISTGGVLTVYGGATTGTLLITASNTLVTSQWYYVMLRRSGTGAGNTTLWVDGVQRGSVQDNTSYSTGQGISVGSLGPAGSNCLDGYISNFRVTRTARSTTSVPTGPFPLG